MVAFNPSSHKLIVTADDLDESAPLNPKVMLTALLSTMGLTSVTIATVAPVDKKTLWWNKDVNEFRRYNPGTSSWLALTPDLFALHLLHRAFTAAGNEGSFANNDLFPFYDVSAEETKMISGLDFKSLIGIHGWAQFSTATISTPVAQYDALLPEVFSEVMVTCHNLNADNYSGPGPGSGWGVAGQFLTAANAAIDLDYESSPPNHFNFWGPSGVNGARSASAILRGDKGGSVGNFRYTSTGGAEAEKWAWNGTGATHITADVAKIRLKPNYGTGHTGSSNFTAGTIKVWAK